MQLQQRFSQFLQYMSNDHVFALSHSIVTRLLFSRRQTSRVLCSYDLDLDPVTLILDLDSDILKVCTCTGKMKFPGQGFQA